MSSNERLVNVAFAFRFYSMVATPQEHLTCVIPNVARNLLVGVLICSISRPLAALGVTVSF
jgi:hypothetical protein